MRNDRTDRVRPCQRHVTLQEVVLVTVLLNADARIFIHVKARSLHGMAKPVPRPAFGRDGNSAARVFNDAQDTAVHVEGKAVLQERPFKLARKYKIFRSPYMRLPVTTEQPDLVRVSKSQLQIMGTHQHGKLTDTRDVAQQMHQLDAAWQIEKGCRFVEDKDPRFLCQSACDQKTLPLSIRQLGDQTIREPLCLRFVKRSSNALVIFGRQTPGPARVRLPP